MGHTVGEGLYLLMRDNFGCGTTGWDEIDGKICSSGFFTLWFYILTNSHVGVTMRIKMTRRKTQVSSKSPNKNPSK